MAHKISRNFSAIGKNIKKIRQAKHLSQSEFASLFNLSRPSVGAYEEGRSEPKIETLLAISKHFGLSVDLLLTRELTTYDIFNIGILNEKLDKAHRGEKKSNQHTCPLVQVSERINYIVHNKSKAYRNELPQTGCPQTADIAFENEGHHMQLEDRGIGHGDLIFCKYFQYQPDTVVVVVTYEYVMARRLINYSPTQIELSSDNPVYEPVTISKEKVLEMWTAVGVYSRRLKKPSNLESRLSLIESQLLKIPKPKN